MRYAYEFVFVVGLLAGTSRGRRLDFYQCNGCGRHTAQSSRGCDFQYDFAPVGEEDVGNVEPVEVHPGEAFEIDVDELLAGVSPSHFVSEEAHSFDWRSTGALYETVGVLRPTRSSVLSEPVDRILMYHELAHKDLEDGLLRSYVPAVPYGEEDGGSEAVIQLSVNMEPGDLTGTFPVNYFSLEGENRLYFCAWIDVDEDAEAWTQSSEYAWEVSAWSACESPTACPYAAGTQGVKTRTVACSHPAVVRGAASFLFSGESVEIPDERCGGVKPEARMACPAPSCKGGLWSEWAAGIQDGDSVLLPAGMSSPVVLDVDTPLLNMVDVRSLLRVADGANVTLTADSVIVGDGGALQVGSTGEPFDGEFDVVLTANWNPVLSRSVENGVGGPGWWIKSLQGLRGSLISLHGLEVRSWSRLASNAMAGEDVIVMVADDVDGWRVGDSVVVVNSDFYDLVGSNEDMNERRDIIAIDRLDNDEGDAGDAGPARARIRLDKPLKTSHYGGTGPVTIGSIGGGGGRVADMRSEVALISRNIRIRGADPVAEGRDGGYGGHVVMHPGAKAMALEFVEIGPFMGQAGRLGRYPVHFHRVKNVGPETYVRGCSIHSTFQRSITIHDTQGLHITDTVTYLARGHAIFLEDGTEINNVIRGNLVVGTRPQRVQDLREDHHDDLPSAFWITNFNNEIENNIAAGTSNGVGFWAKLNSHSEAELLSHPQAVASGIGSFKGNVAHSNHFSGLWIWHDWTPCANKIRSYMYAEDGPTRFTVFGSSSGDLRMESDVETEEGDPVGVFGIVPSAPAFAGACAQDPVQTIEGFTSYKHRDVGTAVYLSSTNIIWKDFTSISDTTAMAFAQVWRDSTGPGGLSTVDNQVIDGLVVAGSASHGNTLNAGKWCDEMSKKRVPGMSASRCQGAGGECHPWPDSSHPSGFPDEEYVLVRSSERFLSAVSYANEGTVGAQVVKNLVLVDFEPNPSCGVLDTVGVHVKPGIGLEFPVGARRVDSVTVVKDGEDVTSSTNVGRIARLHADTSSGNHEAVIMAAAALGSSAPAFPEGALAVVPAGDDDLFFEDNGCVDERVYERGELNIDAVLCDLRKMWMTSWAVDFSHTPLMTSGEGPGEMECTPRLLALEFEENGEPERTYAAVGHGEAGETGIGRPDESPDFYRYRYPFKSVVGKMYLLSFDIDEETCAELFTERRGEGNKGVFLTMEKMAYVPSAMPPRAFDLVLEIPASYGRPTVKSYVDETGGDYGRLTVGLETPYVPLISRSDLKYVSQGTTNERMCCEGTYYVHVRLGERVQGKDTALRLSWGEADDDEYGDEGCSRRCPGGAWPFAPGFEDTSVEAARQRLEN
jgi:hypothetical protein